MNQIPLLKLLGLKSMQLRCDNIATCGPGNFDMVLSEKLGETTGQNVTCQVSHTDEL